MKKYLLGAVALCFLLQTKAQVTEEEESVKTKIKEVGLTTTGLTNNFGLTYRMGNEKMVWRFNVLSGMYDKLENDDYYQKMMSNSFNFSSSIGFEFRKPINEKLAFRYGLDLMVGFQNSTLEIAYGAARADRTNKSRSGSLGMVLGVNYIASTHIIIGMEVNPSFGLRNSEIITMDSEDGPNYLRSNGFFAGFQNSPMLLSAVIRF